MKPNFQEFNNWHSFFAFTQTLTNHQKGEWFELLTIHILQSHPIYVSLIDKVWLLRQGVPNELKEKLNLPNADEGIDIIAQTHAGDYYAIQCKFKSSNEPPTVKELSTFNNLANTHCKNISLAILFHTGERGIRKKHLMGEHYSEVGLEFWLSLTTEDWQRIVESSISLKVKPKPRTPKTHQQIAISSAYEHFIANSATKGRLIMPCGTGKSLTVFWIANRLDASSIIVAVPSLNLIKQSLEDWTREFIALDEIPHPDWQVICSDDSTSKLDNDEFVSDVYSLGIPTTTSIDEIANFLLKTSKGRKIVFTTYQSSERLAQAAKSINYTFDLAIFDEAHKTVGVKSKSFATLLHDENISITRRIFMTATERVLSIKNDDVLSMDDDSIYGKRFYQLTFKDAIDSDPQIISDYKILTIAITNYEIQQYISENNLISDYGNLIEEQAAQSIAAAIALRKATQQYGISHAISFHRSIKSAQDFTTLNIKLNESSLDDIELHAFHISSKKSAGERSQLLDQFKEKKLALMTNARCLTEGVNVPSIDCVLFADPKQSVVDIVQAAGRALRVSPGKKLGYIMMPLIVPDNMEFDDFAEKTPYKQIARIITSLSTQDERIVDEFKIINKGDKPINKIVEIIGTVPVGLNMDLSLFSQKIGAKLWERMGRTSWRSFEEAREYVRGLNFKSTKDWNKFCKSKMKASDIPSAPQQIYSSTGWKGWANFLGTKYYEVDYWTYDEAEKFVQNLKLKEEKEFRLYKKGAIKNLAPYPDQLPKTPDKYYKNFGINFSWGDFLGTGVKPIRPLYEYEDARNYIKQFKFKTWKEFRDWAQGKNKNLPQIPSFIPKYPRDVYQDKGWINIGHWLSTNSVANFNKEFQSFDEAKLFVQKLNLKSVKEWQEYAKSKERPKEVPSHPDQTYKKYGWKGWPDFLGIDRIANGKRVYKTFEEAKAYVRNLKIKGQKEWFEFCKSGNKPDDIPSHPNSKYKISGWVDWSDFLGTKSKNKRNRKYKSFGEAIEFVHGLKLKNQNEWFSYGKSGNKPEEIPLDPSTVYKDNGWTNWGDWLGTLTIATQLKEFQSFENAREYARSLKLPGNLKWMKHLKENNINNYPRNPAKTYKDKGWNGWGDFLGKK